MTFLVLEGDLTSGGEGYAPTTVVPGASTGSSARVFSNNLGVVCQGDVYVPHTNSEYNTHTPIAGGSGSNVFVGPARKEVFTVLNLMDGVCGDFIAVGTSTVNAGQ